MNEQLSLESLEFNLRYFWSRSFDRIEVQSDGKVWAFFKKFYSTGLYRWTRSRAKWYELKIVFHPHPYEAGVDYRFGAMSFGGARLPKQYKEDVIVQMKTQLKNHAWVEEKKRG